MMTLINERLAVRMAVPDDRRQLANLIHFGTYVHRHLDWRPALDWIGWQPYLLAEKDERLVAALACPPDPEPVAWVRLFATTVDENPADVWNALWPTALEMMPGTVRTVAALPFQGWFKNLLEMQNFEHTHDIAMLSCSLGDVSRVDEIPQSFRIRLMNFDDLCAVLALDQVAFDPVWQHSRSLLEAAFQQATIATVAEDEKGLLGYQISTASASGGHLARLAVKPETQSRGIGFALVNDLLTQFQRRGALRVTVNTQTDNRASLSLYERAGFTRSDELYPVYQLTEFSP